jgi:hypothetical protein
MATPQSSSDPNKPTPVPQIQAPPEDSEIAPEPTAEPGTAESALHSTVEAVEAFAELTLAPVAVLRRGHWTHRVAVFVHLLAGLTAGTVAWRLALDDWGVYLGAGLSATVLSANFLRWKRHWGWVRRSLLTSAALGVTLLWGALLFDRAQASVRGLRDPSASKWFWIPTAALALAVALIIAQLIVRTRRDRQIAPLGQR